MSLLKQKGWLPSLGARASEEGTRFQVWAPQRTSVEVVIERAAQGLRTHALAKDTQGTFSGLLPQAQAGDLYRYRLDGKEIFPDPASRFQPSGVHGPSQIIDPRRFAWTNQNWRGRALEGLVIYELHVGTFTPEGTFRGVIERLPHLVDLGVSAIELMPLADFPGQRNWGYDGVALFAPARCYGTPDDLRRLVDAAHGLGLSVLFDVVYNHLGPDGNYLGAYSPFYFSSRHQTGWGQAINYDGEQSGMVREFFIENALHWIHEYHGDGLRLDATHAIKDDGPRPFLADLIARAQASVEDRPMHIFAEDNRNLVSFIKPPSEGGLGFTGVWSDDFHHQLRKILAGDSDGYYMDYTGHLPDLNVTLRKGWFYAGQKSAFAKGPRGSEPEGAPLSRFVVCIQNHDQIGNRAFGERLHHQIEPSAYRAASALLLCAPETPLLFMGQEWAASTPFLYFTDHNAELGKAVSKGRKEEFKEFLSFGESKEFLEPQADDTFQKSKLLWSEKSRPPHEFVFAYYRALLAVRREFSTSREAGAFNSWVVDDSALVIKRVTAEGRVVIVLVQLKGGGAVDLAQFNVSGGDARGWQVALHSEEAMFCGDPQPPAIELEAVAPKVLFSRPGAVVFKAL